MPATRLDLHPLTFVEERDGITVGRADAESYALLPADGAALLRRLAEGMPVPDAADWYRATFGETVDMADFVATLHELGFVREEGEQPAGPRRVRYQVLGRLAFSPAAWLCFAALTVWSLASMAAHPGLRPDVHHIFFTDSLVAVQLLLWTVQMPAVLWHEWFHVLAARRLGIPSRLGISRRLYYVVFETRLDGLLGVPARQRYLPMLAGMLADVLLFDVLVLLAAADLSGGLSLGGRLALALAYTVLLRLVWQTYVFLRTDLYYVATTALGCTDLHGASSAYLRDRFGWLPWVSGSGMDGSQWSPRDRRVAPWFALLTVGGVGFLLATVTFAIAPMILTFADLLVSALAGGAAGGARFWDSVGSLLLLGFEFVVFPLIAGRQRRNRTPAPRPSVE